MTSNKTLTRLTAGINYACTYDKNVKINDQTDIIEEFCIEEGLLQLYCKNNDYVIDFNEIQCKVLGVSVEFTLIGDKVHKLLI